MGEPSEGWLGWTGRDAPSEATSKLRSVRRLALLTLACEAWAALRYVPYSSQPGRYGLVATALVLCCGLGWNDRFARPATAVATALLGAVVVSVFPENANHQFLALSLLAIVLLVRPTGPEADRDRETALQAMRWIAAIGVFWAGVMKLWYGLWLGGEFLSYRIAIDPGFARTLGLLLPEAERVRLIALGTEIGSGPFRAEAPLLVAVSNLTWLAELGLPLALLWPRSRRVAMVATIALLFAIQVGAREIFFGGLMIGLLLLFARGDRVATALPWIGATYGLWLLRPELSSWLAAWAGS